MTRNYTTYYVMPMSLIIGLIFFGGCGKQRPLTVEQAEVIVFKAKQIEETITEKYRQELSMVRAAVPFEKIQARLSGLVGMMDFEQRFIDVIDGRYGPDRIPFHFYERAIRDDIDSIKTMKSKLKRVELQAAGVVNDKLSVLLDDLSILKLYVLRHSEYRSEERYMEMLNR